ncbi:MAG: arsenate reductase ArsC [Planctomycetes bacterium]|nr:arsenate reductase ArsC [Planctomycetota bacterium]
MMRRKILFLCTGNSCRSQMGEAWTRAMKSDLYEAYSAGTIAKGLNPKMVQVMREVGIDPAIHQTSKTLQSVLAAGVQLDLVVTVCGHAHETCPVFPGGRTRVVHVGFEDPPELEKGAATPEEALGHYRRVRDQIRDFVAGLPGSLPA